MAAAVQNGTTDQMPAWKRALIRARQQRQIEQDKKQEAAIPGVADPREQPGWFSIPKWKQDLQLRKFTEEQAKISEQLRTPTRRPSWRDDSIGAKFAQVVNRPDAEVILQGGGGANEGTDTDTDGPIPPPRIAEDVEQFAEAPAGPIIRKGSVRERLNSFNTMAAKVEGRALRRAAAPSNGFTLIAPKPVAQHVTAFRRLSLSRRNSAAKLNADTAKSTAAATTSVDEDSEAADSSPPESVVTSPLASQSPSWQAKPAAASSGDGGLELAEMMRRRRETTEDAEPSEAERLATERKAEKEAEDKAAEMEAIAAAHKQREKAEREAKEREAERLADESRKNEESRAEAQRLAKERAEAEAAEAAKADAERLARQQKKREQEEAARQERERRVTRDADPPAPTTAPAAAAPAPEPSTPPANETKAEARARRMREKVARAEARRRAAKDKYDEDGNLKVVEPTVDPAEEQRKREEAEAEKAKKAEEERKRKEQEELDRKEEERIAAARAAWAKNAKESDTKLDKAEQDAAFAAAQAAEAAKAAEAAESEQRKREKSWPRGVHVDPETKPDRKKPRRRVSWSDEEPARSLSLERVAPTAYYTESEGEDDDDGAITFSLGTTDPDEDDDDELSTPAPVSVRPKRQVAPSLDIKGPKMEITERQDALPMDDPSLAFSTMYGDGDSGGLMF
mmetsp:Transcript_31091/g.81449  ORF Transcript_31091/g.81449 Transcript_31091/m.81449 type:complete len:684 (-) Transcript_31091:158-2209(-)|eukprot:CAMPEP_0182916732 /NCGR_PEP_ID=MMETSP0105_2-20130417/1117_1 /TAXON_ID=81532 ORGANISM="Acanthoeca-like sp., Strain 10tr" /NCGR_SAMPLE_ID=MMETSP0105_2 /ASSEMBLY_ACC=CAM_ASM_000205 /LENGTH=683 /DNA_ID=CAMNT_0025053697 /DNA_START=64 /DNA_END=2115 /DNA_ORIENTATION=+